MRPFDHDYAEEIVERLSGLSPDARPRWGRLTQNQLHAHLADALRYPMGRNGGPVDRSTWFTRRIMGPLVLSGWWRIPEKYLFDEHGEVPEGNLETLQAVLEDYLDLVQAGELEPLPHSRFGELGVDGWARFHVAHFEHHLRQFGV